MTKKQFKKEYEEAQVKGFEDLKSFIKENISVYNSVYNNVIVRCDTDTDMFISNNKDILVIRINTAKLVKIHKQLTIDEVYDFICNE